MGTYVCTTFESRIDVPTSHHMRIRTSTMRATLCTYCKKKIVDRGWKLMAQLSCIIQDLSSHYLLVSLFIALRSCHFVISIPMMAAEGTRCHQTWKKEPKICTHSSQHNIYNTRQLFVINTRKKSNKDIRKYSHQHHNDLHRKTKEISDITHIHYITWKRRDTEQTHIT